MKRLISDAKALDLINEHLDGQEWSADTIEYVANIVEKTGRPIRPSV